MRLEQKQQTRRLCCFSLSCSDVHRKRVSIAALPATSAPSLKIAAARQTGDEEEKKKGNCGAQEEEEGRVGVFPQPQQQQHCGCGHLLAVLVWPAERLDDEALAAIQAVGQVLLVTGLEVFRVQRRDGRRRCHTKRN